MNFANETKNKLEAELKSKRKELSQQKEKTSALSEELVSLNRTLNDVKRTYGEKLASQKEENERMGQEIQGKSLELESLRQQLAQKDARIKQLRQELRNKEEELQKLKGEFQETVSALESFSKKVEFFQKKTIPSMKKDLQDKETEISVLKEMLKSAKTLIRTKEIEQKKLRLRVSNLETENEGLKALLENRTPAKSKELNEEPSGQRQHDYLDSHGKKANLKGNEPSRTQIRSNNRTILPKLKESDTKSTNFIKKSLGPLRNEAHSESSSQLRHLMLLEEVRKNANQESHYMTAAEIEEEMVRMPWLRNTPYSSGKASSQRETVGIPETTKENGAIRTDYENRPPDPSYSPEPDQRLPGQRYYSGNRDSGNNNPFQGAKPHNVSGKSKETTKKVSLDSLRKSKEDKNSKDQPPAQFGPETKALEAQEKEKEGKADGNQEREEDQDNEGEEEENEGLDENNGGDDGDNEELGQAEEESEEIVVDDE